MKKGTKDNSLSDNGKTILILALILVIIILTLIILVTKAPTIAQTTKGIFNVVSVLLGGLGGALAAILYSNYRTSREYKSLILAFASELILAFERCVLYYKQSLYPGIHISYSALFDFTDASALSKIATVTRDSAIIEAIMYLKAQYFQVGRHVEDAAKFIVQAERSPDDKKNLVFAVQRAQLTALAFFIGADSPKPDLETYKKIKEKTSLVLNAAKNVSSKKMAEELSSKFSIADKLKDT
jgi:hypothetical protein